MPNSIKKLLSRTSPVNKFLRTPIKITKKHTTNKAIKTNFYTKKGTTTTPTAKKTTGKIAQAKDKGNIRYFGLTDPTTKVLLQTSPKCS